MQEKLWCSAVSAPPSAPMASGERSQGLLQYTVRSSACGGEGTGVEIRHFHPKGGVQRCYLGNQLCSVKIYLFCDGGW